MFTLQRYTLIRLSTSCQTSRWTRWPIICQPQNNDINITESWYWYHCLLNKISRNHDICLHHARMVPATRRIVQTAIVKKIGIFTSWRFFVRPSTRQAPTSAVNPAKKKHFSLISNYVKGCLSTFCQTSYWTKLPERDQQPGQMRRWKSACRWHHPSICL